jgi:tetratricopeptide (TPR) repeat protein
MFRWVAIVCTVVIMGTAAAAVTGSVPAGADTGGVQVVVARDIRNGGPVGVESAFTGTDPQACVHVTLLDVDNSHLVRAVAYRPDGSVYESIQTRTSTPPYRQYYPKYRVWWCLPIAEHEPAFRVGEWRVDVFVDGRLARTVGFQILGTGVAQEEKIAARLQTLQARVDANPSDPRAHLDLAEAYIDQHKLDEAAAQLQRAIALDPGLAPAHAVLGYVNLRQGHLEEAERKLLQAVRLSDDYAWAHYQLAVVYKAKGDTARATEQFQRVVRLAGDTSIGKSAQEELAKLGAASQ